MDHPECDCNNHIEEALAHVCSSNNDSNNGTMGGKYEAAEACHWQLQLLATTLSDSGGENEGRRVGGEGLFIYQPI